MTPKEIAESKKSWVEFVTQYNDIFTYGYCGYWLKEITFDKYLGWLVWEEGEEEDEPTETEYKKIIKDWRTGKPLPKLFYRLDKAAANKAWREGVKKYGIRWYEDGDAITYDVAIQLALLGENKYG